MVLTRDFRRTKTRLFLIRLWNELAYSRIGRKVDIPSIGFMPISSRQRLPEDAFIRSQEYFSMFHHVERSNQGKTVLNKNGEMLFLIESDPESNEAMHKIMKEQNLTLYNFDKIIEELGKLNLLPQW